MITPIERSIANWLFSAGTHVYSSDSKDAWLYEPPPISEIFTLAKLKHDIVRHHLPADDLKILIAVYQAPNYGLWATDLLV